MNRCDKKWMNCPVCNSADGRIFAQASDIEYYTSDEIFNYIQCPSCDTIYLDSPPVDQLSKIYPANYYSYDASSKGFLFLEKIKIFFDTRTFRKLLFNKNNKKKSIKILDIGGGTGWLLNRIQKTISKKIETHIVDLDENAKAMAELAGHIFHCSPIENFTSLEKFDLIIMFNLIEHVADPASVLKKVKNLLADGGAVIIKTPNINSLDCRLFQHDYWGGLHCPRHWVLFTRDGFVNLVEQLGFYCVNARYTQGAPFWTTSILFKLAKWRLICISSRRPLLKHPLFLFLLALTAAFDFIRLPFFPTSQVFYVIKNKS